MADHHDFGGWEQVATAILLREAGWFYIAAVPGRINQVPVAPNFGGVPGMAATIQVTDLAAGIYADDVNNLFTLLWAP